LKCALGPGQNHKEERYMIECRTFYAVEIMRGSETKNRINFNVDLIVVSLKRIHESLVGNDEFLMPEFTSGC
jgi:hypothetical protein